MSGLNRHPKTHVYIHRKGIPTALRDTLGRREIKKTLGTKDRRVAEIRNHQVGAFVSELLNEAQDLSKGSILKPILDDFLTIDFTDWDYIEFQRRLHRAIGKNSVSQEDIVKWADRWFENLLISGRVNVQYVANEPGILVEELTARQANQAIEMYINDTGLRAHLETAPNGINRFRDACFELLTMHSEGSEFNSGPLSEHVHKTQNTSTTTPVALTLTKAFGRYVADAKLRPRTELDWMTACNRFVAFFERDPSITQIRPEDIIAFRDKLGVYPRSVPSKLKNASFQDRCEYAEKFDLPRLSPKTVNKNLQALAACFNWLIRNRLIRDNPVSNIRATINQSPEGDRLSFSNDDLSLIFGSEYLKQSASADFWVPWLALYSGARLEELAKLTVADVEGLNETPYIHIRGRLKNKGSVRRVPVHSSLLKLGFIEHVRQRGASTNLLFEDVEEDRYGKYSAKLSKRFGGYIRRIGISDERKVFHSFRHLFKDACRDADVPLQVQNAILGHTSRAVGEGYGQGFSIQKLSEWIERINHSINQ